ncbi:MAG: isochorismatase family protein [Burkholderiales bacterium]|nr:isochorismatase family protein [Burkholderiales bacterium]
MDAIDAGSSVLLLVDFQSRLMPAIHDGQNVTARALLLARVAHALDIPVLGTEQNPNGLGPNVEAIRARCAVTLPKTRFDACADGLVEALHAARPGAGQVVVAGCEAHVCMMQTALGLLRAGKRVWVVSNACGSRRPVDHAAAMDRLDRAGATLVTHEMVVFEWLRDCAHPGFKDVLGIVKEAG